MVLFGQYFRIKYNISGDSESLFIPEFHETLCYYTTWCCLEIK